MERLIVVNIAALVLIIIVAILWVSHKTRDIVKQAPIEPAKPIKKARKKKNKEMYVPKKLNLPSELTSDGHFEAYVLKYFNNQYVIDHKLSSPDDIASKVATNETLVQIIVARGISNGCVILQYNNDVYKFMEDCKQLYLEIIRCNPKYNPANPNCIYFETQNKIAMGEIKPKYETTNDPSLNAELVGIIESEHEKDTMVSNEVNIEIVRAQFGRRLSENGFSKDQINVLSEIAITNPNALESTMTRMHMENQQCANLEEDHLKEVDIDDLLSELGMQ